MEGTTNCGLHRGNSVIGSVDLGNDLYLSSSESEEDVNNNCDFGGGSSHSSSTEAAKELVDLEDDLYLSSSDSEDDKDECCNKSQPLKQVKPAAVCDHNYDEDYDQYGNAVENASKILGTDQVPLIMPSFTPRRLMSTTLSDLVSNQEVQAILSELKPGKRLRFTRLHCPKPKSRYFPFRKPILTSAMRKLEENSRRASTTAMASENETGFRLGLPKLKPEQEEEVMKAYNELDDILKPTQSDEEADEIKMGKEGPAKLWYDMLSEIGDLKSDVEWDCNSPPIII